MLHQIRNIWFGFPSTVSMENAFRFSLAQILSTTLILYFVGSVVYNLYFHPLRKYPGPFLARSSLLWRLLHSMGGRFHIHIENCHKQYGDVFRVSPNELSFCTASAWQAIYGPNHKGVAKIPKAGFYDLVGAGLEVTSMVSERDPVLAFQKRELFAPSFSPRSLQQQEPTLHRNINLFVEKMGKLGTDQQGINLTEWFMHLSFDLLGEMAFGDNFGCVEREASHPWIDSTFSSIQVLSIMDNLRHFPFLVKAAQSIPSKWTVGFRNRLIAYAREKTAARLLKPEEQIDFLEYIATKVRKGEISRTEMEAQAWTLALAGGESTATALTGIIYFLLRAPEPYAKLNHEIRAAFASPDEISVASATKVQFLMAVLKEGLRMLPVGPQGAPRISPGVMVDNYYVPPGIEFYVSPWSSAHDERSWNEPYTFKPERWFDAENTDDRGGSQPFSLGPRVCPGRQFAYAQMSVLLAKLVYTYEMELVNPDLDWVNECRAHLVWKKVDLMVRFKAANG